MAYTPNNSFGSDDIQQRGRPTKRRALTPTPSKLPSPQATDTYDSSSDADKVLEAIAHDIQLDDTHSSAEDSEIERAFQVLWSLFCGLPEPTSTTPRFHFHCGQRSYERLYTRLHEHPGLFAYFETLRVDWNAATGVLVIRSMPARPIHDIFQNALVLSIERELDHVAVATPALQPFRSKLSAGGTTAIEKRKKGARRNQPPEFEKSPDGQWLWAGNRYPAFVFEVAYSQEEESLADKVAQFFEQLPSDIGSVLGFDIEYADKADRRKDHFHGATVSLWVSEPSDDDQALDVTRTIHQEPFRDRRGKALPGECETPGPFTLVYPYWRYIELIICRQYGFRFRFLFPSANDIPFLRQTHQRTFV